MDELPIPNWNEYFFLHCYLTARKSRDRSTKVGSVIVNPKSRSIISEGYNSPPRGVNDNVEERHERPIKYNFYEHSESNSILNCARNGIPSLECYLYTLSLPCSSCSRAIIQAGISKIYIHDQYYMQFLKIERWKDSFKYSREMLEEANVEISVYSQKLNVKALCDGKIIEV